MGEPAADRGIVRETERMVTPDRALELVLGTVRPLDASRVDLMGALGTVLVDDVAADRDYPPFDRALMDGFAVRAEDAGRELDVAGDVVPGASTATLPRDAVMTILTGAPCPTGCDAVVPHELVEAPDRRRIRVPTGVEPGANVTRRGAELERGATALRAGTPVTPLALAVLGTVGATTVLVRRRPSIGVVTTGGEVTFDGAPAPEEIRDANGPMLTAMARLLGLDDVRLHHASDSLDALAAALAAVADRDVVVTVGAVSAGRHDLVPEALAAWGATTVFRGVRQRPGRPLLFARRDRQAVFALPGNPLSAQLCFHRYVTPAIRAMMGLAVDDPRGRDRGTLRAPVRVGGSRTLFQPCRVQGRDASWLVTPTAMVGSADVFGAAEANAVARFEPRADPYPAGMEVDFEWHTTTILPA